MKASIRQNTINLLVTLLACFTGAALAGGLVETDFDWANNFVGGGEDPLVIDNAWWPLVPGTVFTYEAESEDGCETSIMTVTSLVKRWPRLRGNPYSRIRARVVHDAEYLNEACDGELGDLMEDTYDWYAQDIFDNIWYLGEYTVAYDHEGECDNWVDENDEDAGCEDGSFQAGIDGAEAGIVMLGDPQKGDYYSQEYYEDEAEDMGKVLNFVPVSSDYIAPYEFDGCLKTKEWTPLEPGSVEHKYYCMPVGLILIEELQGVTKWVDLVDID